VIARIEQGIDRMADPPPVNAAAPLPRAGPWPIGRVLLQLLGTCAVLALVPGNLAKLGALVLLWAITFGRLTRREALVAVVVCVAFTAMDVEMVKRGAFAFDHPDIAGLPAYEFLMWGFYVLHATRTLGGYASRARLVPAAILALAFTAVFATLADPRWLAGVAAAVVVVALAIFRERRDFAYAGYMALVGLLIECTGVLSGQWHYPGAPPGGVPVWSLPMWAGIGLFVRRIVTPFLRDPAGAPW
jgi:hypothetical protein